MTINVPLPIPGSQEFSSTVSAKARAHEVDSHHALPSWPARVHIKPMTVVGFDGSHVWGRDGNELLDHPLRTAITDTSLRPKAAVSKTLAGCPDPAGPSVWPGLFVDVGKARGDVDVLRLSSAG